jgi:hypothetical protein
MIFDLLQTGMRNPNVAVCRKQDAEDFDASTITPTTRMMSTWKVTVQAKLHVTIKL